MSIEILSGLKFNKNRSFLSFIHLFESEVSLNSNNLLNLKNNCLISKIWITLFLFIIISFLLFQYLTEKQMNYRKSFDLFIRLLTNQSTKLINNFLKNIITLNFLNRNTIVILITTWIIGLNIMTKAITGNLLKTYFNVKSVPIVNTLDDLHNIRKIKFVAQLFYLSRLTDNYGLNSNQVKELSNKAIEGDKSNLLVEEPSLMTKLFKGDMVILSNSLSIKGFQDRWAKYGHLMTVSNVKYLPLQAILFIGKGPPIRTKAALYVSVIA